MHHTHTHKRILNLIRRRTFPLPIGRNALIIAVNIHTPYTGDKHFCLHLYRVVDNSARPPVKYSVACIYIYIDKTPFVDYG